MGTYTPNLHLYKPDESDPFGEFREKFNDNMDALDNGGGGGGGGHTIIDENDAPMTQRAGLQFTGSCSVTDDAVNDKTVVNISGGGGGSFFGCAIDENNKLFEGAINDFNQSLSYTATEDGIALCWYRGSVGTWQFLLVNGVTLRLGGDGTNTPVSYSIPIRKGDTVAARYESGSESCYFWLTVYGIKQGTSGIFAPVIYSDNERCIGVWRDNKPLYQKTWDISDLSISYNSWTISTIPIGDIETIVNVLAVNQNGRAFWGDAMASIEVDATYIGFQTGRNNNVPERYRYVTIQYTKTTDTAGSGDYNTYGVPTVHYSTSEQVIGTYLGKPLYQITYSGLSLVCTNANQSYATNANWGNIEKVVHSDIIDQYGQSCAGSVVYTGTPAKIAVYMQMANRTVTDITIQYTKTTD